MTILQFTRILRDYLIVSLPETDLPGLSITSISGSVVTLSNTTGTTNEWVGGIFRVTSGDNKHISAAILANSGNTVTISTPFDEATRAALVAELPECELQGGPLRDAKIFHIAPKSIKDMIANGDKIFVYINPLDVSKSKRALGGNGGVSNVARNQLRAFNVQLIASVPFYTGGTSVDDTYLNQTKIYDLEEQITARLMMFASLNQYPLADEFDINTNFGLLEPDGGQKSEIAVIEVGFSLVQ